jgi:hypothetical protein
VFLDRPIADVHTAGNRGVTQALEAMQRESLAAARRKLVNGGKRALQLLFAGEDTFRIGCNAGRRRRRAKLSHESAGAPFPAPPIDKKVSRNPQDILERLAYQSGLFDFECFDARLLGNIFEFACTRASAPLALDECTAGLHQGFLVLFGRLPVAHG